MRIKRVILENWRAHENLALDLEPITIVVGPNGAGKSSIASAIHWALTGHCAWTDARGSGAEWLIRRGAKSARVAVDIEGVGTVERQVFRSSTPTRLQVGNLQGSATVQQDLLYRSLGCDADVLDGMLHLGSFMEMKPREQVERILRLVGQAIPRARVVKHIGLDDGVVLEDVLDKEEYDPADLEAVYNWAYSQRRAEKQALTKAEQQLEAARALAVKQTGDVETLRQQLAEAEIERDRWKQSALEARVRAEQWHNLKQEAARLEQTIASLQDAIQQAEEAGQNVERLEKSINKKVRQVRQMERELSALKEQRAQVRAESAHLQALAEKPTCPLAAAGICQTPPEALAAAAEQAKAKLADLQKQEGELAHTIVGLESKVEHARAEITSLQAEAASARAAAERVDELREQLQQAQGRYGEVHSALASMSEQMEPAGLEDQIAQAEARVAALRRALAEAEQAAAYQQQVAHLTAQVEALRERVQVCEAICKALAPAGRNLLLVESAGPAVEQINTLLEQILPGRRLTVGVDPEPHLCVVETGADPIPLAYLSESERMRVAIAIQLVLANMVGVRFLVLDEVDRLDPDNRSALLEMLLAHRQWFDTVLILSTRGDVQPVDPGIEGLAVWVLDKDGLQRAPAMVEAVG